MIKEREEKRKFLHRILEMGIEVIQLPCPEFWLYGSNRWGHAASQFDTPFFRQQVKKMLGSYVLQWKEYKTYQKRFEILGIVGIDGSPSCGVNYTYDGEWGGEFSGNPDIGGMLKTIKKEEKSGIMIQVLKEMMREEQIDIPLYSMETLQQVLDGKNKKE